MDKNQFIDNSVHGGLSRRDFLKYLAGSSLAAVAAGCGGQIVVGGHQIQDMSKTRYALGILKEADELAANSDPKDWRSAIELYRSIGRVEGALDKMDDCAYKYLNAEPQIGLVFLESCQKAREFYRGKPTISLESIAVTQRVN